MAAVENLKFIHIVTRNTSTLDYSIPILCAYRESYPTADIFVLYCVLNKKQLLRNSRYYDDVFSKYAIRQYDYLDFLRITKKNYLGMIRMLFEFCYYDYVPFKEFLKNPFFLRFSTIRYILAGFRKRCDSWITSKFMDKEKLEAFLESNVILFDHRARIDFEGSKKIGEVLDRLRRPVILVPHAAHVDNEVDEFVPFSISKDTFPDYCDHWSSFKYSRPYLRVSVTKRKQFSSIGHPGLDSSWISSINVGKRSSVAIRVLVLTRRFLSKGERRSSEMDPGLMEYQEVLDFLKAVHESIKKTNRTYKIIVKPHPSSGFTNNVRVLREAGVENYHISYEPFFALLPQTDVMITEFSTSIAFSVLYGIPTVVLHSRLQTYVHESWRRLCDLYSGLSYYVKNPDEDLEDAVVQSMDREITQDSVLHDIEHFREYFVDGAIVKSMARTKYLIQ